MINKIRKINKSVKEKRKIKSIINELEKLKKKSYSNLELRTKNSMMDRLNRLQDVDLNNRINAKEESIKKQGIMNQHFNKETRDIFDFFNLKRKNMVQRKRGGFF